MKLTPIPLWSPRCQIGGYRDDVVVIQVRHHFFHQHVERTVSRSSLKSIELTCGVERGNSDDPWKLAQSLQRITMADCALNRFAGTACLRQGLALCDAATWHVGNEAGVWIAARRPRRIFRHFDDAIADRLGASARERKAHARLVYIRLWYGIGFHKL